MQCYFALDEFFHVVQFRVAVVVAVVTGDCSWCRRKSGERGGEGGSDVAVIRAVLSDFAAAQSELMWNTLCQCVCV